MQAENIRFTCFLKQKEEQEAQASVPVMPSAEREMHGNQDAGLHRMEGRSGILGFRGKERPHPVPSQKARMSTLRKS